MDDRVQLSRIVGTIAGLDQLEAAMRDLVALFTNGFAVVAERLDAIESREQPAPQVSVAAPDLAWLREAWPQVPPPPAEPVARFDTADIDRLVGAIRDAAMPPKITTGGARTRDGLLVRDVFDVFEDKATISASGVTAVTFAQEMALVVVRMVGGDGYANLGAAAADGTGVFCPDAEPQYLTFTTGEVSVWLPAATTCHVHAFGYSDRGW